MPHRVFVYGSLLPSLPNHDRYLSTSKLLGFTATAAADYLLVDSDARVGVGSFPYALDNVQESTVKLVGVLYEVSDETLARLD